MHENASSKSPLGNPWVQLFIGVVCMACVANLQYGWTWFVNPIDAKYHFGRAKIQFAFSLFVLIETWLIPVEGYLVDRFGPRGVVLGGAVLVAAAWALNSVASSLPVLYIGAALGGIGTGCVYGTCVGNALKWFPGRRGLAAGITAAGFGAVAATISKSYGWGGGVHDCHEFQHHRGAHGAVRIEAHAGTPLRDKPREVCSGIDGQRNWRHYNHLKVRNSLFPNLETTWQP